jgi:hypothetical protein
MELRETQTCSAVPYLQSQFSISSNNRSYFSSPILSIQFYFYIIYCMSQSSRSPAAIITRKIKPPHPSPSPRRTKNNKSKSVKILKRCSSAPLLISPRDNENDLHLTAQYSFRNREREGGGTLFRPQTFSNAFVSSPSLFPSSPKIYSNEVSLI